MNLDAGVWTVPGDRTKTRGEHRVPLSNRAMAVVREARAFRENDLLFPTATGRTMSDNTLSKLLREIGIGAVPHGFRSTFRDWCGEHDASLASKPRQDGSERPRMRSNVSTTYLAGRKAGTKETVLGLQAP